MRRACIGAGAHYLDLADDADFVSGFGPALHDEAVTAGCVALSVCSTTPALTTAVIDAYEHEFESLEYIKIVLSPGNRLPRGVATIASVVSYIGKAFMRPFRGAYIPITGWRGEEWEAFHGIGTRLVAQCKVPDLTLLPQRYPSLLKPTSDGVEFKAGLEISALVWGLVLGARVLPWLQFERHAQLITWASMLVSRLGSDDGGMKLVMRGARKGTSGLHFDQHEVVWSMFAGDGHGPQTPVTAAVILAERLAIGEPGVYATPGARACMGQVTEKDFRRATEGEGYHFHFHVNSGSIEAMQGHHTTGLAMTHQGLSPIWSMDQDQTSMPSLLREFHFNRNSVPCRVKGIFDIVRSANPVANLLAVLGGLPPAMEKAQTTVEAQDYTWRRQFGSARLESRLSYEGGLVLERFSVPLPIPVLGRFLPGIPMCFGFHWLIDGDARGFQHITKKMWFAGVLVPQALMLRADGSSRAHDTGDGWHVMVSVVAPWLGELVRYEGDIIGKA